MLQNKNLHSRLSHGLYRYFITCIISPNSLFIWVYTLWDSIFFSCLCISWDAEFFWHLMEHLYGMLFELAFEMSYYEIIDMLKNIYL